MREKMKAPEGTYAFLMRIYQDYRNRFDADEVSLPTLDGEFQLCREKVYELIKEEPLRYEPHDGPGMNLTVHRCFPKFVGVTYKARINPDDTLRELSASPNVTALSSGIEISPADIDFMLRVVRSTQKPEITSN